MKIAYNTKVDLIEAKEGKVALTISGQQEIYDQVLVTVSPSTGRDGTDPQPGI